MKVECFDVVVVGGGVSGLTAAYQLQKHFKKVAIIEPQHWGGVMKTEKIKDFILEQGPNVIVEKPETLKLISELELEKVYPKISKYKQYVYLNSKAVEVPKSLFKFVFSPLLSTLEKIKLIKNLSSHSLLCPNERISVFEFGKRLMGESATQNILDPVLRGIYGGDLKNLEFNLVFPELAKTLQDNGSILDYIKLKKRNKRKIFVLKNGNYTLIEALLSKIEKVKRITDRVIEINPTFEIKLSSGKLLKAKSVIIATSGSQSANFLNQLDSNNAKTIATLQLAPLVVLHFSASRLGFFNSFGVLFPKSYKSTCGLLGVMFNSKLFNNLCPSNSDILTVCLGGIGGEAILDIEDKNLIKMAKLEIDKILGIESKFLALHRWPQAIPQYNADLSQIHTSMKDLEANYPGLVFAGADIGGVGVPDRISQAFNAVDKIKDLFNQRLAYNFEESVNE